MRWLRKVASARPPPGRDPAKSGAGGSAGVTAGRLGPASGCAHGSPARRDVGLTVGARDLMPVTGPIGFSVSKRDDECSCPAHSASGRPGVGARHPQPLAGRGWLLSDQELKLGSLHRDDCSARPWPSDDAAFLSTVDELPSRAALGWAGRARFKSLRRPYRSAGRAVSASRLIGV
jgi:hypothetical protein